MAAAALYSTLQTQAASTFIRMWGISPDCCLYISIDNLFLLSLLSITEALSVCSSQLYGGVTALGAIKQALW